MTTFGFSLSCSTAEIIQNMREKYTTQGVSLWPDSGVCPFFSHRHKEATVTDSLKWKLKLTAWRMSILWNIFLCAIALQICAPKRKLCGSKEDHSFQPSVRLVHSPSAADISDSHKHLSKYMRHKWWNRDTLHQYMSTALCHARKSRFMCRVIFYTRI